MNTLNLWDRSFDKQQSITIMRLSTGTLWERRLCGEMLISFCTLLTLSQLRFRFGSTEVWKSCAVLCKRIQTLLGRSLEFSSMYKPVTGFCSDPLPVSADQGGKFGFKGFWFFPLGPMFMVKVGWT